MYSHIVFASRCLFHRNKIKFYKYLQTIRVHQYTIIILSCSLSFASTEICMQPKAISDYSNIANERKREDTRPSKRNERYACMCIGCLCSQHHQYIGRQRMYNSHLPCCASCTFMAKIPTIFKNSPHFSLPNR